MLLQLSHLFSPLFPSPLPVPYLPPSLFPHLSSCPWVIYIRSLAFPILFLTSRCPFCTYHLGFSFPVPFPPLFLPPAIWFLSAYFLFQCLWLYFACWFVLLIRFLLKVRSYGLYFIAWLISLSIMLSSSIHAVEKGRSSFFLSVA